MILLSFAEYIVICYNYTVMKKLICVILSIAMVVCLCGCEPLEQAKELGAKLRDSFSSIGITLNNFKKTLAGEKIKTVYSDGSIKIGVFEPQSGKSSGDAEDEILGIELAHKLFPTVMDNQVELVYSDNHSDTEYATEAAQNLVDSGCNVVIGSYSNVLTMAALDTFEENQVLCICPSCSNPLITTTTDYFFRVAVVDSFQGNAAAKYIIEHLPKSIHGGIDEENASTLTDQDFMDFEPMKCAILKKSGDERATALIERFQAKFQEIFGADTYVKVVEYRGNAKDLEIKDYLDRLAEGGTEVVFFPSTADEGLTFIFESYQRGYNLSWVGGSDWAALPELSETRNLRTTSHLDNVTYVAAFDKAAAATEMTQVFIDAAQQYYRISEPSEAMALGFDAYILALESIKSAGGANNSENLQYAASRLYDVKCATGSVTYRSGNGDPVKDVVIEKFVKGKIQADYTAGPVWKK